MILGRFEEDLDTLRTWAVNRAHGKQGEQAPEPYMSWLRDLMPEECRRSIGHWCGIHTPSSLAKGGWLRGFPHIHQISVGWVPETYTIITYLTVPEKGGEFAYGGLSPDDPYELIMPEEGLTVGCDAVTWHGVKQIHKGTRTALISTGFPNL